MILLQKWPNVLIKKKQFRFLLKIKKILIFFATVHWGEMQINFFFLWSKIDIADCIDVKWWSELKFKNVYDPFVYARHVWELINIV